MARVSRLECARARSTRTWPLRRAAAAEYRRDGGMARGRDRRGSAACGPATIRGADRAFDGIAGRPGGRGAVLRSRAKSGVDRHRRCDAGAPGPARRRRRQRPRRHRHGQSLGLWLRRHSRRQPCPGRLDGGRRRAAAGEGDARRAAQRSRRLQRVPRGPRRCRESRGADAVDQRRAGPDDAAQERAGARGKDFRRQACWRFRERGTC